MSFRGSRTEWALRRVFRSWPERSQRYERVTGVCAHVGVLELLMRVMQLAELEYQHHLWFRGFCPSCRRGFTCDMKIEASAWRIVFVDEKAAGGAEWHHVRPLRFSGGPAGRHRRRSGDAVA